MIKIVWIVNEKYTNNFITVYNEIKKDNRFDVSVIAAPRLSAPHCDAISSAEIAAYLKEKGISCTDCCDCHDGKYLDLRELSPDYVFRSTWYDIYYPEPYRADVITQYAKLCFVEYGAWLFAPSVLPSLQLAHFLFCSFDHRDINLKCTPCGNLKLDEYLYYGREPKSTLWSKKHRLKVLWKPRWTLEEDSTLFEYIEQVYTYLQRNDFVDLVFLAHPMLYSKLKQKNRYEEFEKIYNKLLALDNFHVEESDDYLDTAYTCDVLIADVSSIIAECAVLGKEVIYTEKIDIEMNSYGKKIMKDHYVAHHFEEIEAALQDVYSKKINGSLPRNRIETMHQYMFVPPNGMSVAQYILQLIYEDHYSIVQHILKQLYEGKRDEKQNESLKQLISEIIARRETIISRNAHQIRELEDINANLCVQINGLKESNECLNAYNRELEKQNEQRSAELLEIQNSTSWRLTKPLRSVIDFLHK